MKRIADGEYSEPLAILHVVRVEKAAAFTESGGVEKAAAFTENCGENRLKIWRGHSPYGRIVGCMIMTGEMERGSRKETLVRGCRDGAFDFLYLFRAQL